MKVNIVDSEIRVVHPEARNINYAKKNRENFLQKFVYSDKNISKAIKLWSLESVLKSMRKSKIKYGILSGLSWQNYNITKLNNEYIKNCLYRYPNKFRAFYLPNFKNIKQTIQEINNLDKKKYVGVEIYPYVDKKTINDKQYKSIIKAIKKNDLFLRIIGRHSHQSKINYPYSYLEFLKKNNNLKTIITALGGGLTVYSSQKEVSKLLKKAYFTTSVSSTMEMIECSSKINSNNLLFATDYPFNHCFDQKSVLKEFLKLNNRLNNKNKILGLNALKIFNLKK